MHGVKAAWKVHSAFGINSVVGKGYGREKAVMGQTQRSRNIEFVCLWTVKIEMKKHLDIVGPVQQHNFRDMSILQMWQWIKSWYN